MEEILELHKCIDADKFIEIIDEFIQALEDMREKVRQEIYYDEL